MPYVIGNLIVTVLPETFDPNLFGSIVGSEPGTPDPPSPPQPPPEPPPGEPGGPPPGPDSVFGLPHTELRLLLQFALTQLGGPLTLEDVRPRSFKDLDELEEKLSMAISEVREMRTRFTDTAS